MNSRLYFQNGLPPASRFGANAVLIYDRVLARKNRAWISSFAVSYGVSAGESLKDVRAFANHVERIARLLGSRPGRDLVFVVAGGGSVGDFGGFLASVFKRGVRLVQIPSTWLSAMDSAHGGKTALNVSNVKNQIGTFYPASEIFVCRELLRGQKPAQLQDALAELAKIALLSPPLWRKLTSGPRRHQRLSENEVWRVLPLAIAAKMKVVHEDPREETGVRQILNLGHTWGHVVESLQDASHGAAVGQGLMFALAWSFERGLLSLQDSGAIRFALSERFDLHAEPPRRKLALRAARQRLVADKKSSGPQQVTFIFLKKIGRAERTKVLVDAVIDQARNQGWL